MNSIYLDNSATTIPFKEVIEETYNNYFIDYFNPSALYKPSLLVRKKVEACRIKISNILSCKPNNLYFLASGTDANNLAILSFKNKLKPNDVVLFSAIEHPSVINTCKELEKNDIVVNKIPVNTDGTLSMDEFEKLLNDDVKLICIMHVNNEVGVVNELDTICLLRDKLAPNAAIHVDGVQGFLKVPFSFKKYNVQSYSLSAHKIHGFKGTGVLAVNKLNLGAYRFGGGQEMGVVSGTENTIGIIALSKALDVYAELNYYEEHLRNLKTMLVCSLKERIPETVIIGPDPFDTKVSAPNILNVAFPPLRSDVLLNALASEDIYISSGSACSSTKQKVSSVLREMKIPNSIAESAIRISMSILNTETDINKTVDAIRNIYYKYSKYVRR